MRRLALLSLTVSGIVLILFGMNIVLFMLIPGYHDALIGVVTEDEEIPIVIIDENKRALVIEGVPEIETPNLTIDDVEIPLSENADVNSEKRIVDKTYYEDCGSEKGYWIIKYEDGSTSIEQ